MANYYNQLIFVIIRNVLNFSKQLSIIKTCLIFKENLKILFRANLMTIIDGHQPVCFATTMLIRKESSKLADDHLEWSSSLHKIKFISYSFC